MIYDFKWGIPEFFARGSFGLFCSQFAITSVSRKILAGGIYFLTLSYRVFLSFFINSVDVTSGGVTSWYLPSNSFEIFCFEIFLWEGNCLTKSISFLRVVDILYLHNYVSGNMLVYKLM